MPITVLDWETGARTVVAEDETIRPGTTVEGLAALRPAFESAEMAERFPEIDWSITAGNSSQLTDGASAVLIMSEELAEELGLVPRARFHAFAVAGDDPITMLTAPIPATERVLERAGLAIEDLDHYRGQRGLRAGAARLALPLRAPTWSGSTRAAARSRSATRSAPPAARLMTTMLCGLEASGGRYGLQTMCEAGGMANATIIERI